MVKDGVLSDCVIIKCGLMNGLEDLGIVKVIGIGLLPSIDYFELRLRNYTIELSEPSRVLIYFRRTL